MSIITAATNFIRPVAKWVTLQRVNQKLITNIVPQSFPLLSSYLKYKQIYEYIESSLIIQKKGAPTEVSVRGGSLTYFHQNLLFRTTMKQRSYRNLSHVQMRTYCAQGGDSVGRDKITSWFSLVNTGTKISGGGVLILLFATIVGWAYCESYPEKEICESTRNRLGIKKKINRIPISAPHYVLRKAPIEKIRNLFSSAKEDHPIVAIVGDPASGKTELSKQYAREYKNAYHHIWFVQVETWEKAYRNLAMEWRLFTDQEIALMGGIEKIDMVRIINEVHRSFTYLGRKKSLIVFENAPKGFIINQLQGQLPTRTDILVTSRSSDWETTLNLSSDKNCQLTLDEGFEILRKWIEDEQWNITDAKNIITRFNYSPVPIAQAGSYLCKSREKMGKYLPLFEQNKQEILKGGMLEGDIDIVVSLKMAMDQVEPEARELLHYCAFLPAKNIPREFLEKLFDPIKLNKHIRTLDTLILADTTTVSIHDLFQEIIEGQISSQKRGLLSDLGKASDGFEKFLLEHPRKALPIFQQSLVDHEQGISPDEIKIASISNFLGMVCRSLGDYHTSLEYDKKSLEICKRVLGKEHPDTAMSYNSIGMSLWALGRREEALKYHKKSLEIREKVLGKEHPDTAMSYNIIGVSLGALGRREEALEYQKKSLEIREKVLGKEHPNTAMSYNNIGLSLGALERHEEALKYHKKSLEIREKVLGKEHPDTAMSYNSIGVSLWNLGHYEEALGYFKKAF